MSVAYFAYGSNMASSEMAAWCPEHRVVGRARLDGRRLELRRRSIRWRGGAADIVPGEGAVWGVLYDIPDSALDRLDAKEGEGLAYRRREVEVLHDGEGRQAIAYEVIQREPDQVPCLPEYRELLVAGARERELPEPYVRELERLPVSLPRP